MIKCLSIWQSQGKWHVSVGKLRSTVSREIVGFFPPVADIFPVCNFGSSVKENITIVVFHTCLEFNEKQVF